MPAPPSTRPKAVVLLSGGMDSATTAAIAQQDGFDVHALSVRYGQRHAAELVAARRVAAALGIPTVDVGNPMLSMHSAREMCGSEDHGMMIRVLREFYRD